MTINKSVKLKRKTLQRIKISNKTKKKTRRKQIDFDNSDFLTQDIFALN